MALHVSIDRCERVEGLFYEVNHGEFGPIQVYDIAFRAVTHDGKVWEHKKHVVKGWYENEDGFACPNRNSGKEADAFVTKVLERGRINLDYWKEVEPEPAYDLEDRLRDDAYREQWERRYGEW